MFNIHGLTSTQNAILNIVVILSLLIGFYVGFSGKSVKWAWWSKYKRLVIGIGILVSCIATIILSCLNWDKSSGWFILASCGLSLVGASNIFQFVKESHTGVYKQ